MLSRITNLQVQGPIAQNDMLVAMNVRCPMCGGPFECGDRWAAMPRGPMNAAEAAKADAGLPFRALCEAVHFGCVVERLVYLMNWRGQPASA